MRKKEHTYRLSLLFSAATLIALLILSPCKVRNSIESVFNLEKTEVLNKSITTINNSNTCTTFEQQTVVHTATTPTYKQLIIANAIFNTKILTNLSSSLRELTSHSQQDRSSYQSIPFYILYQSIKAYL